MNTICQVTRYLLGHVDSVILSVFMSVWNKNIMKIMLHFSLYVPTRASIFIRIDSRPLLVKLICIY